MIASRENRKPSTLWSLAVTFCTIAFLLFSWESYFPNDPNDFFRSRVEDSRWFWSRSRRTGKMKLSPGTTTLYYITGTITSIHSCPHPSTLMIDPKICGWNWNQVENFNLIIILSAWSDCMVIISNLRSVLGVDRLWRLEQQIQSKLGVRLGLWIYPLRRQIICAWNTENKSRTTCFALFSWVLLLDIHHGSQRQTFPMLISKNEILILVVVVFTCWWKLARWRQDTWSCQVAHWAQVWSKCILTIILSTDSRQPP